MTAYIDTLLSYCKSRGISEKDIVPVVRCKDCKHFRFYDGTFGRGWMCFDTNSKRKADDFCSRGKRRDEVK